MERAHTWPSLCTLVGMARRSPHTQPARAVPSALAVALGLVLGLSACGSSAVSRGASYYAEGRYIDAAQLFEQTEPRLSGYDGGERALYGLYRGSTLLALGDVDAAERWLSFASEHSHRLTPDQRRALAAALESVRRQTARAPIARALPEASPAKASDSGLRIQGGIQGAAGSEASRAR